MPRDRGTRGLDRVSLLNGDGRAYVFNGVDIRAVQKFQKLPCVGAERLRVPAVAFRMQGIKYQRGFSSPTQSGNYDQLAQRKIEIDILQVILPDAAQADG